MDVLIRGQNFKVSDNLEAQLRKKLDKLDRYMPNIKDVRVDLSRQHAKRGEDMTVVQITLRHERGAILRSEVKKRGYDNDTTVAAVNEAIEKMYRRIQRFKGKRRNRKDKQRFIATQEELNVAEAIPDYEEYDDSLEYEDYEVPDAEDARGPVQIVRRKNISVQPMTEVEAIEQMELLGHNFFMFFNSNSQGISVLYKRESGGYGVLVPENHSE